MRHGANSVRKGLRVAGWRLTRGGGGGGIGGRWGTRPGRGVKVGWSCKGERFGRSLGKVSKRFWRGFGEVLNERVLKRFWRGFGEVLERS